MENKLVQLYLLVCQIYDNQCSLKYQRLSNFKPNFSDEEIITIYLFGQLNEKFNHRQIYNFIREYWLSWFPGLPSYQAFNRRLNLLTDKTSKPREIIEQWEGKHETHHHFARSNVSLNSPDRERPKACREPRKHRAHSGSQTYAAEQRQIRQVRGHRRHRYGNRATTRTGPGDDALSPGVPV